MANWQRDLGFGLGQLHRQGVDRKNERAEAKMKEGVRDEFIQLRNNKEFTKAADLRIKNPWLVEEVGKLDGWSNKQIQKESTSYATQILSTDDVEEKGRLVGDWMAFSVKNGGNTDESMPAAQALMSGDPEPLNDLAKANLATNANGREAYKLLTKGEDGAKDAPQYTPTDEGNFVQMEREQYAIDHPDNPATPVDESVAPPKVLQAAVIRRRRANVPETRDIGMAKNSIKKADDAFTQLGLLAENKANMNEVVELLSGPNAATTGPVAKWFPSFRENTIKLMQVQKRLGLDVVRKTTFGALSKGELDLAKEVGMPESLKGPALRQWAVNKRNALAKLENYIGQYAHYLSSGGTDTGWFEMQRLKRHSEAVEVKRNKNGLITHYRYSNGEVEEVN